MMKMMMMKITKFSKEALVQTLLLTLGSTICAFAIKGFLVHQGFLSGGLTGASLVVYYVFPELSLAKIYILINIPIFLLGAYFVSLRFILYSLWGMVIYSIMLHLVTYRVTIADPMLSAIIAGGISGIGIAIILRSRGSTGDNEIVGVMLHKLFSLAVGTGGILVNILVLAVSAFLFPLDKVLYSLIYAVVTMQATNAVYHGMKKREAAIIISDHCDEIADILAHDHRMGITKLSGKGGYRGTDKTVIFSVIHRRDIACLKKIVLRKDPDAFIAMMTAGDVTGLRIGNQPHW